MVDRGAALAAVALLHNPAAVGGLDKVRALGDGDVVVPQRDLFGARVAHPHPPTNPWTQRCRRSRCAPAETADMERYYPETQLPS